VSGEKNQKNNINQSHFTWSGFLLWGEKMKKKFILEFDEEPALVFIQHKTGSIVGDAELYQDGIKVKGWRDLSIRASVDDFTTHEVEYITGQTNTERREG
jgi:hypothetical protein